MSTVIMRLIKPQCAAQCDHLIIGTCTFTLKYNSEMIGLFVKSRIC